MTEITYCIEQNTENERIDSYLTPKLENLSRSYIQKLINDGFITVNNNKIKRNYKVKENDTINICIPDPKPVDIIPENIPISIVYEDNDIAIINKPQGMVVHPAPGHISGTLVNALLYHFKDSLSGINGVKRPGIVHRIDKDTSGLLVICKNDYSHKFIANQLKDHSITRKYNAIVYNNIKADEGIIDEPIGRHPIHRKKMAVNYKNGKRAVTHYKVLERFHQFTHIEAQLETGRTHQIRVHMSYIGHPLLGDEVYGPKSTKRFKLNGQTLHARVLGFIHPSTKKYIEFQSELPSYFINLINNFTRQI